MKIFLLPIDIIFLTSDTLRGIIRIIRRPPTNACPVCDPDLFAEYNPEKPHPAKKYFNPFVFRLLCPNLASEEIGPNTHPCERIALDDWPRKTLFTSLGICLLTWTTIIIVANLLNLPTAAKNAIRTALQNSPEQIEPEQMEKQHRAANREKKAHARWLLEQADIPGATNRMALIKEALIQDPHHYSRQIELIKWHVENEQFEEALIQIESARSHSPDSPHLDLYEAYTCLRMEWPSAAEAPQIALKTRLGKDAAALVEAAEVYRIAGRFIHAAACLDTVATLSSNMPSAQIEHIKLATIEGRLTDAAAKLAHLPLSESSTPDQLQCWIEYHLHAGNIPKAIKLLRKAIDLPKPLPQAPGMLCDLLLSTQSENEAKLTGEYLALSTNTQKRFSGNLVLAKIYMSKNIFGRAVQHADLALADHPNHLKASLIKTNALIQRGDLRAAEAVIFNLGRFAQRTPRAQLLLARAQLGTDLWNAGWETLKHAVKAHPDDLNLAMELGNYYHQKKQPVPARAVYEQYLKRHPENSASANNLARLLADWSTDLNYAERLARQNAQREPDNAVFSDTLGWVLVRLNRPAEAQPYLEYAIRILPDHPAIRFHLSVALHQLGNDVAAFRQITRALHASPVFSRIEEAVSLQRELQLRQQFRLPTEVP